MQVICYLSNGYPDITASKKKIDQYYEAGCRIIEIDLPSTNPYLEGELISGRMHSALENCSDYDVYLDAIAYAQNTYSDLKVIILAYEDTIEAVGTDKLIAFCQKHQIPDMIIVGDKKPEIKDILMAGGVKVSCYIRYHLPEDEIEAAKKANGFIYLQAKPIGSPVNPKFPTLKDCITELRSQGLDREIYCGVGVHAVEDIQMVKNAGADAAFIGSSILKVDHDPGKLHEVICTFVHSARD